MVLMHSTVANSGGYVKPSGERNAIISYITEYIKPQYHIKHVEALFYLWVN